MRARAPLLAATLALAACKTVGPDYHGPPPSAAVQAPAAQGPFVSARGAAFTSAEPQGRWWRLYDDPVLDDLEQKALAANTDLRVAAANLARAEAAADEVREAREVRTAVAGGVEYGQPSAEQYLQEHPVGGAFLYTGTFEASYQLDLFGRIRRATEAADADVEAARAAADAARVTVAAETARAYAEACGAALQRAAAERSVALQQETARLTRRMAAAGRAAALDLTRSQALVEQSRASLPQLEAARRAALFRLAALTGRPAADVPAQAEACSKPPRLTTPLPVGDGAALLRRRPDVRQAERQLAAATARIGVATADLYPTVSFGGSVGSIGLVEHFLAPATQAFGIGPSLSWSFPNQNGPRARIRAASAAADQALARFDGVVLTSLREAETALDAYARALERDASLTAERDQARQALEQTRRLYQAGKLGFLPVLDAERALAAAESALAASQTQLSADQVAIFLALGGGWSEE